jgi:non-heme chloroperoxidase
MFRLVVGFAAASCILIGVAIARSDDVKRVSANGTELSYVEVGQGEPVIFVHGGLQDYRMWLQHLPRFADRYRAIAYSRRNHFPNEVSPEGMPDGAADAHGEDLAAFVRALGLSKVRVVAHSSGAHAALFFAAVRPEMVVSLTLNEPPATGILAGVPGVADMLKEWGNAQAPAREAVKAGDVKTGIPLFVNAVGGPGAYERRSNADQKMNFDNVASFQADATTNARGQCSHAKWQVDQCANASVQWRAKSQILLSNCRPARDLPTKPREDHHCRKFAHRACRSS